MAVTWSPVRSLNLGYCASVNSTQTNNETAAPVNLTDGIFLDDVGSIVPIFSAPNGNTFANPSPGSAQAWWLPDQVIYPASAWVRLPSADIDLTDAAGLASWAHPAIPIVNSTGRLAWQFVGASFSGGTLGGIALLGSSRQTGKAK